MRNKNHRRDAKLVKEFQLGNEKVLVDLVKDWHRIFCDKAFWITKDAELAKDIAQECWQIIIAKLNTLKQPERFGSWALRIVYTKSIDAINLKNTQIKVYDELKQNTKNLNIEESDNTALKNELLKAINVLPNHQQIVLKLFYVQNYSLKEIADLQNISVGTVKSRLYHAREKLKYKLKHIKNEN